MFLTYTIEDQKMDKDKPIGGNAGSIVPPKKTNTGAKYLAVIIALIVIAGAFGFLYATKAPSTSSSSVNESATLGNITQTLSVGQYYNFTIKATGTFDNITVWWGDGTTTFLKYDNSTSVKVSHQYNSQGEYYILYQINYGSTTTNGLIPLSVGYPSSSTNFVNLSYAFSQLVANSTAPVSTNPALFGPGASLTYQVSYSTPSNPSFMVVNLTVNVYQGTSLISSNAYPLVYSSSGGGSFVLPQGVIDLYLNNLATGFYTIQSYVTVGSLATATVSVPVTNTTTYSYNTGQKAFYNETDYTLPNGSTVPVFPTESLQTGSKLMNYMGTNLTYNTAANVSYSPGVNFSYNNNTFLGLSNGTILKFGRNTNITPETNTNVSLAANNTVYELTGGKTYEVSAGNETKFLNATNITVLNATMIGISNSTYVNYAAGQSFEYLNSTKTTYNANASMIYNNKTNYVTYENKGKVKVSTTIMASTSVNTGTAVVNSVANQTTVSYTDIPIYSKVSPYSNSASSLFFDALPNAVGGYTTLDPAISFYTASNEILLNTLLQLDQYNGTSTTSFIPELAQYLPTTSNGGVNTNSYTYWYNNSYVHQEVNVSPGENFTYHIRSGIIDQFGNTISAYDVYFEIVRDMLFSVSSPGTGGYLIAGYFFKNYTSSTFEPTYQGIMPYLSYNNSTDNFTIHFFRPMPTTLVYQLFAASGTYVESAAWLTQHGSGITFTPSGFQNYTAEGSGTDYNTYVQNHIAADGPYEISLVSPAQFVILVANPNFHGLPGYPAAQSAKTVEMQYTSSDSTAWLEFSSGQAQDVEGLPPTYWNQTLALEKSGKAIISSFPTLSIYFYNFNINIDTTLLHTVDKSANLPANFFLNHDVRLAFAYAYNYSYYFAEQIGNKAYNATFQVPYAGMLVPGLPDSQNITALNNSGANVPYTDLAKAAAYWNDFFNSTSTDGASAMGIKGTAADPTYNGAPLDVPIFVLAEDLADEAGASTWVQMLQTFIPGLDGGHQDVIQTSEVNIFETYAIPQADPMPISWGGWAPDYPYPTDYLSAMFLPSPSSTYQNANSWNSSFVAGKTTPIYGTALVYSTSESMELNNLTKAYNNGVANETNSSRAGVWFQKANEIGVNLTMEVYLGQADQIWQQSSIVNLTGLQKYQENVMIGGGQELMYNYITYNNS